MYVSRALVFACTSITWDVRGRTLLVVVSGAERREDIWSAQGHPQRSGEETERKRDRECGLEVRFRELVVPYPASKVLFVRFYSSSSSAKRPKTDSALSSRVHRAHACWNFERGINRSTHSLPFLSLRIVTPFHFLSPLSASSISNSSLFQFSIYFINFASISLARSQSLALSQAHFGLLCLLLYVCLSVSSSVRLVCFFSLGVPCALCVCILFIYHVSAYTKKKKATYECIHVDLNIPTYNLLLTFPSPACFTHRRLIISALFNTPPSPLLRSLMKFATFIKNTAAWKTRSRRTLRDL